MSKREILDKYYTPEQARKIAGYKSVWTIYRNIKNGNLKTVKLTPRVFLIEKQTLNQFLKKHKTK